MNQDNSELEKQWREEFESNSGLFESPCLFGKYEFREFSKFSNGDYSNIRTWNLWQGYLEACKKRQEENDNLLIEKHFLSRDNEIYIKDIQKYADRDNQRVLDLRKRDKLIEQAKPWLEFHQLLLSEDDHETQIPIDLWLKEVEELK